MVLPLAAFISVSADQVLIFAVARPSPTVSIIHACRNRLKLFLTWLIFMIFIALQSVLGSWLCQGHKQPQSNSVSFSKRVMDPFVHLGVDHLHQYSSRSFCLNRFLAFQLNIFGFDSSCWPITGYVAFYYSFFILVSHLTHLFLNKHIILY